MKYLFVGILFLLSFNLYSKNYAFVNLNYLIENNKEYIDFLDLINVKENNYRLELDETKDYLSQLKNEIDTSSLILSEIELEKKINDYNMSLERFNQKIKLFNTNIENDLLKAKKLILIEIRNILIEISNKNNYDFILDENNILIVDNKLDISNEVLLLLNEKNIHLEDILNKWDLIEF